MGDAASDGTTGERLAVRQEDVVWRQVDNEVVILDLSSDMYMRINPSGAVLWDALRSGTTRGELESLLRETYSLEAPQATADVEAFLSMLDERGLLVTA